MVTADQGWGCFIPDGLPWQHHAMLLVKSSTMSKNRTNLLMDKEMLDICIGSSVPAHTLGATHPSPWLIERARLWLALLWLMWPNIAFNWFSQQSRPSPTPVPKLPLLLFDAANWGSAGVDPGN